MPTATVRSKGQITIPKEIREHLKLKKGSRVRFTENPDGSVTLRARTRSIFDMFGTLKPKHGRRVTIEEMNAAIRRAGAQSGSRR